MLPARSAFGRGRSRLLPVLHLLREQVPLAAVVTELSAHCREGGLMAADPALIAIVAPAMDQPELLAFTAGATEPLRPARLLQSGLTLLLGAVEPLELTQREAFLELDGTARRGMTGICVPAYAASLPCAE